MKSTKRGKSTSVVEVTNVSIHGLWLYVGDREYFLSFDENPWFKKATIGQLSRVELLRDNHLHWPELDVDLELDAIKRPGKYPLIYR